MAILDSHSLRTFSYEESGLDVFSPASLPSKSPSLSEEIFNLVSDRLNWQERSALFSRDWGHSIFNSELRPYPSAYTEYQRQFLAQAANLQAFVNAS
jgi:hypothetical protein